MDEAMTHDRCSELLPGYVRGELTRALAEEVRAHLGSCEDCRAEERAVATLAAVVAPDPGPLQELERARMHRGLAQELFTSRANADVAGAAGRRWSRWVVPAAAAAAVLAAVAVTTLGGGAGDSDSTAVHSSLRANDGDGDGGDAVHDSTEAGSGKEEAETQRALSGVSSEADAAAGAAFVAPGQPEPRFDRDAGALTPADLSEIGRGKLFRSFAAAYRPDDGAGLYDGFLDALGRDAPELRAEIDECAATLPQDGTLIPAYATTGEYDGRDALVLGFVTSDPGSRKLDRYLMWVWARGECDQPVDTLFEYIEPR